MRWFIADTHFGEDWVDNFLPAIKNCVGRKDELFVLGDFGDLRVRHKIPCSTWLILGNHDKVAGAVRAFGQGRVRQTYMLALRKQTVQGNWSLAYANEKDQAARVGHLTVRIWLSHYPHLFWPSSHNGACHAYGHMHGEYERYIDNAISTARRSMDVGAMCSAMGGRPIADFELASELMQRRGHHHPSTLVRKRKETSE